VPLASGAADGPQPHSAAGVPPAAAVTAAAVLAESNRIRASLARVGEMRHDPDLQRAAQAHANELAERRVLDHASPTPGRRTMTQRIDAAGVAWTRAAENLGQLPGPWEDIPRRVVQMWLDSPGHRSSLLDPDWTHSAVGIAADQYGYYYVVQLYLVPRRR
jgi:uncharacterized protein YkwD